MLLTIFSIWHFKMLGFPLRSCDIKVGFQQTFLHMLNLHKTHVYVTIITISATIITASFHIGCNVMWTGLWEWFGLWE